MTKKMLIDATHPEETRVVIVQGNKLEDFDFESAARQQLIGNIYLAKVTRVEPSLQAAFVEYGGNRHGFLAFNEIHPDYYQIPIADRQALLDADAAEEQRAEDMDEDVSFDPPESSRDHDDKEEEINDHSDSGLNTWRRDAGGDSTTSPDVPDAAPSLLSGNGETVDDTDNQDMRQDPEDDPQSSGSIPLAAAVGDSISSDPVDETDVSHSEESSTSGEVSFVPASYENDAAPPSGPGSEAVSIITSDAGEVANGGGNTVLQETDLTPSEHPQTVRPARRRGRRNDKRDGKSATAFQDWPSQDDSGGNERREQGDWRHERRVESVGGEDALDEVSRPRSKRRHYKIQEVIKKRQILLVQVLKDERGSKGAALTTYLSIPGRYCVLMPNTARGGGISRKISNAPDRKRLKAVAAELDVPEGMGLIIRTAGANRTKAEIKRDFEYLLRQWENIRELTLRSTAPCLINEEGSIIKRAVRDLYDKDIDSILVEGEAGYREAKDLMRMLMPSHAKKVQPYREPAPLFQSYQIEPQLDSMFDPTVRLKSGGYIVINPTEALVSIDVNSGKATREANIEATALRTNMEAAEEVARQLRLRDLAGLIVVDFIDMDNPRNDRAVERKLKDCLATDRARIQVGRISPFGLLEMSRQRLRQGVVETTTRPCPHCSGTGLVRSVDSLALHVLRGIEEEAAHKRHRAFDARVPADVAIYILNQKRDWLAQIEARAAISVYVIADADMQAPNFEIKPADREVPVSLLAPQQLIAPAIEDDDHDIPEPEAEDAPQASLETSDRPRRRQRERARGGERTERPPVAIPGSGPQPYIQAAPASETAIITDENGAPRRRRRRRRGGHDRGESQTVPLHPESAVESSSTGGTRDYSVEGVSDAPNEFPNEIVAIPITDGAPPPRFFHADIAPAAALPEEIMETPQAMDVPVTDERPSIVIGIPAAIEIQQEQEPAGAAAPESEQAPGPKRGGWWQRRFGGA